MVMSSDISRSIGIEINLDRRYFTAAVHEDDQSMIERTFRGITS
jgi:hypothetical protein